MNIDANRLDATSEGTQSYTAHAVTIGKGVHTLKETPQSVTVMTRKMLDDQNLNTLEQVLDKTPGITVYDSPMGGKYFYSRGFNLDGQYQYDGVPLDVGGNYVQANSFSSDMAFYDRVEILKGAAGMMKAPALLPAASTSCASVARNKPPPPSPCLPVAGTTTAAGGCRRPVKRVRNRAGARRGVAAGSPVLL